MLKKQTPTFDDYAEAVGNVLKGNPWVKRKRPWLVLEPGVAMAANTMCLVMKVVSVKNMRGETFVTVDGSAFHTKPTFHKINPPLTIISKEKRQKQGIYNVVGATCMEKDYLLTRVEGEIPRRGDYIKIDSVGAYTIVLSPTFIHPLPAIVVMQQGQYRKIRRRQSFDDMFGCYSFE